jgi:hypothetical protein
MQNLCKNYAKIMHLLSNTCQALRFDASLKQPPLAVAVQQHWQPAAHSDSG